MSKMSPPYIEQNIFIFFTNIKKNAFYFFHHVQG